MRAAAPQRCSDHLAGRRPGPASATTIPVHSSIPSREDTNQLPSPPLTPHQTTMATAAILLLATLATTTAKPLSQEQLRNAIIKHTEKIENIYENDTDFVLSESNEVRQLTNRDLVKSLSNDYDYYYNYEEDPIIHINFKRSVANTNANAISRDNSIAKSEEKNTNAYPKSRSAKRKNRKLNKNLRRNRRLRKMLRKNRNKFQSNRT